MFWTQIDAAENSGEPVTKYMQHVEQVNREIKNNQIWYVFVAMSLSLYVFVWRCLKMVGYED